MLLFCRHAYLVQSKQNIYIKQYSLQEPATQWRVCTATPTHVHIAQFHHRTELKMNAGPLWHRHGLVSSVWLSDECVASGTKDMDSMWER